jgi:hypothetical protein
MKGQALFWGSGSACCRASHRQFPIRWLLSARRRAAQFWPTALFLLLLPAAGSDWTFNADVALKETFDSNVYLQDATPNPAITDAAQPNQHSMVTSVTPKAGFTFKPCSGFNVAGHYTPEIVEYHDEASESHVAHRLALLFNGVVGKVTWQMQNSFTYIDGSDEGLTFGAPGGAPAIGGIPLRDRREALIYRNSFGAFHNHGNWFFRPAASSYIHDFRTEQRDPAQFPFYQNYVDRNDFNLGLDVGYKAGKDGYAFIAYRCGWQHENQLPPGSFDYSNDYQRLLLGYEGKITGWLKLNLFIGPDWRNFNHSTPPGFDQDMVKLYVDGSAAFTLSKVDTVLLTVKKFVQPAFGTPSAYEDITYEIAWRHRWNEKFSAMAGFKIYGGDWEPPVLREDWIYTPSASLSYAHNKHLSAELAYSYDWVDSQVPNTPGREFTRHLVSAGVRYAF